MEWSASTIVESHASAHRSSEPFDYVFKLNASAVVTAEKSRILENGNFHTTQGCAGSGHHKSSPSLPFIPPVAHAPGNSHFNQVFIDVGVPPPLIPAKAQTHLSCAREVLDRKRRMAELSQDEDYRMNRKRRIHEEGVEIRKSIDRPTKRLCHEMTRDCGLLSEHDMELEASSWRIPQVSSVLSHKRLLPLFQSPLEGLALYDPKQGVGACTGKTPRKSRLSECYTAHS